MLNISKQIYVGWDSGKVYSQLAEAEIIPLGDSDSEKKKLNRFVIQNNTFKEIDNIPLPGFTLHDVGKKKFSSTDSTWLVIDPRGFLVRITQDNMADILKVTGITEGLIQQKCVWAREDEKVEMELIPISSPRYLDAVSNTVLLEEKVSIDDVEIGDTVLLQNGYKGTYLGVLSLYCTMYTPTWKGDYKVQSMIRKQVVETEPGKFFYNTDAKILKILNKTKTTITREDSAIYLNDIIKNNPNAYFTSYDRMGSNYYGSRGMIRFVSTHAAPKVKIKLEEIDRYDATILFNDCRPITDSGCLVVEDSVGKKYLIDFPWLGSLNLAYKSNEFFPLKIKEITEDKIILPDTVKKSYYDANTTTGTLDNYVKFYKIVKCVKNDTYI